MSDEYRTFDHEHPCPSSGCRDYLRGQGKDVPDDMDCCICWGRALIAGTAGRSTP